MYMNMCTDMCIDMCVNMCMNMCTDKCTDIPPHGHVCMCVVDNSQGQNTLYTCVDMSTYTSLPIYMHAYVMHIRMAMLMIMHTSVHMPMRVFSGRPIS